MAKRPEFSTVSATALIKAALPDRRITKADADAMRGRLRTLSNIAASHGWTPEYVATLDEASKK